MLLLLLLVVVVEVVSMKSGTRAGGGGGGRDRAMRGWPPLRKKALEIGKGVVRAGSRMLVKAVRL